MQFNMRNLFQRHQKSQKANENENLGIINCRKSPLSLHCRVKGESGVTQGLELEPHTADQEGAGFQREGLLSTTGTSKETGLLKMLPEANRGSKSSWPLISFHSSLYRYLLLPKPNKKQLVREPEKCNFGGIRAGKGQGGEIRANREITNSQGRGSLISHAQEGSVIAERISLKAEGWHRKSSRMYLKICRKGSWRSILRAVYIKWQNQNQPL